MTRDPFGWDYPAGAEHDPDAPYNTEDAPKCPECGKPGTESVRSSVWDTYIDLECEHCGHCWYIQTGPDPDEARDAMRDDELTGDR